MAWNWGSAGAGAASGAATGSMMLPGWGTVIGGVGGAVMGGLSGSGEKGQAGQAFGPSVVTLPQYSFTEPRMRLASDYISQNIERMSRGEMPAWWDKASPVMREGMSRQLKKSYYGTPGDRSGSAMGSAMEAGALTGIGPASTAAQVNKLGNEYADKEKSIDEYLTGLGVDIMQKGEQTYLSESRAMPKGPDAQVVGPWSIPGTPGNEMTAQDIMGLAGSIDWNNLGSDVGGVASTISNWLNKNKGVTGYSPSDTSGYNSTMAGGAGLWNGNIQAPPLSSSMYNPNAPWKSTLTNGAMSGMTSGTSGQYGYKYNSLF